MARNDLRIAGLTAFPNYWSGRAFQSGRTPGPIELRDLAGSSRIAELADTVFTLGRSHAGDDLRYLKHLKSRTATPTLNHENTPVLQLSRLSEPPAVAGGLKTRELSRSSAALSLTAVHRPLSTVSPFLGLTFWGPSAESIHLTDRFAEPRTKKRISAIAKPKSKMSAVEILLSSEYWRYLER